MCVVFVGYVCCGFYIDLFYLWCDEFCFVVGECCV